MQKLPRLFMLTTAAALTAGCGSAPPTLERDPAIEEAAQQRRLTEEEIIARQEQFGAVMVQFDTTLDKYAETQMTDHFDRSRRNGEALERYLSKAAREHFDDLMRAAEDTSKEGRGNRTIAVAALGFAKQPEAMQPLLNALQSDDPKLVINALMGLGTLADPRTPLEVLARLMEDDQRPLKVRIGASWALLEVQETLGDKDAVVGIWFRMLSRPANTVDPGIVVHAVRGVGLTRNPKYADRIEPFVSHPTPLVRATAAIALGRLNARSSHTSLIALIGPAETNPTVRLCARKALQALAGDADRGYDQEKWRKVFEDGNR